MLAGLTQGSGVSKPEEIAPPTLFRRAERVVPEKEIKKSFPQPGQLPEAVLVPGIVNGQVQEFQCPEEGQATVVGIALFEPIESPFDLASNVGKLFDQRERLPPAGRESFVLCRRHVINPETA